MSSDAIVVEGLGKQYTIGTTLIGDATLGESLTVVGGRPVAALQADGRPAATAPARSGR